MGETKRREARQKALDPTEWERIRLIDKVEKLETKVKALESKLKDLENRGERKSLAVLGMISLLIIRTIYRREARGGISQLERETESVRQSP